MYLNYVHSCHKKIVLLTEISIVEYSKNIGEIYIYVTVHRNRFLFK
jgi:hypothetical protein